MARRPLNGPVENDTPARIALAMVGRSSVSFEVLKQWIGALREIHWPGPTFLMPEIYAAGEWIGVVPARNLCTHVALQRPDWDGILWIDADHKINHQMFERLQEHMRAKRAVVGGPYYMRGYPFEINAFGERTRDGVMYVPPQTLVPLLDPPRSTVIPVAGVGTGTMLVRRDVLERMAELRGAGNIWHAEKIPWEQQIAFLERGEPLSGVMTEDILFCLDVAELLGEQVWLDLDPRMETGHQGEQTVDRRHYLAAHQITIAPGTDLSKLKLPKGYEVVRPK
jgi:hypothetical protein